MKTKSSDLLLLAVTLAFTMSLFSCATSGKPLTRLPEEVPLPKDIKIVLHPANPVFGETGLLD